MTFTTVSYARILFLDENHGEARDPLPQNIRIIYKQRSQDSESKYSVVDKSRDAIDIIEESRHRSNSAQHVTGMMHERHDADVFRVESAVVDG